MLYILPYFLYYLFDAYDNNFESLDGYFSEHDVANEEVAEDTGTEDASTSNYSETDNDVPVEENTPEPVAEVTVADWAGTTGVWLTGSDFDSNGNMHTVTISNQTEDSFDFVFEGLSVNGASGYVEGTAMITGETSAVFLGEDDFVMNMEYYPGAADGNGGPSIVFASNGVEPYGGLNFYGFDCTMVENLFH